MRPFPSMLAPAVLALAGALASAGCQRETAKLEPASPPVQTAQTAAPPVSSVQPPAPPVAPAPMPSAPAPPIDRNAAELGQPPRTLVISPEDGRRESLEAREKRLAARQAAIERRERRLRQREERISPVPAPAPAPSAAESEAASAPAADAGPEPAPAPRPRVAVTLPEGTTLDVEIAKTLSSATSKVGDTFRARVAEDVVEDGEVAIPAGSEVVGEVTQAAPIAKKIGGQASLGLRFTDLILPSGETVPVSASLQRAGKNESGRDAATIGGAAAGGAILGNILNRGDRGRGSVIGALIGAVAGTAIAARTKGEEVEIAQGSVVRLQLDRAVRVHRPE